MCFIFNPLACQCSRDGEQPQPVPLVCLHVPLHAHLWGEPQTCPDDRGLRHGDGSMSDVVGRTCLDSWALSWELPAQKTQVPICPLWITWSMHTSPSGSRTQVRVRVTWSALPGDLVGPAIVSPSPLVGEGRGGLCGCLEVTLLHISWPGCGDSVTIHQQTLWLGHFLKGTGYSNTAVKKLAALLNDHMECW